MRRASGDLDAGTASAKLAPSRAIETSVVEHGLEDGVLTDLRSGRMRRRSGADARVRAAPGVSDLTRR